MNIAANIGRGFDPAADRRRVSTAALAATLLVILALNFFVRWKLDESGRCLNSFILYAYKKQLPDIYAQKWWQFLLPCKHMTGGWGTTGLFLVHGLEHVLGGPETVGPARAYYLGNALLITTAFLLSWGVFRSYVFSTTLALCFALTTYNHHVYLQSGTIALLFVQTYLLFFLYSQFKLMQPDCNHRIWIPAFWISLLFYALSYEGWLDCPAWMWIVYPFLILVAHRNGDRRRVRMGGCILAAVTFVAVVYVLVKTRIGLGQTAGSESDVVFNYGRKFPLLIIDDLVSHFITLFYITVTTYMPPQLFCYSNSLWAYGPDEILKLQGGYDPSNVQKVLYNHIFFWRYFAGAFLLAFVVWWNRSVKTVWTNPTRGSVFVFLTLSMVLLSGATHMLVKYRAFHSLPYIGYHSYFGVVGMSLLVAFAAMWIADNVRRPRLAWTLIGLIWFNLLYCAIERPGMLSDMSKNCGYGPYPSDAKKALKKLLGLKPEAPKP